MKRFGLIALVLSVLVIGVVIWLGLGPSHATSDQTQTSSPSLTKTGQPSSLQDKLAAANNDESKMQQQQQQESMKQMIQLFQKIQVMSHNYWPSYNKTALMQTVRHY